MWETNRLALLVKRIGPGRELDSSWMRVRLPISMRPLAVRRHPRVRAGLAAGWRLSRLLELLRPLRGFGPRGRGRQDLSELPAP